MNPRTQTITSPSNDSAWRRAAALTLCAVLGAVPVGCRAGSGGAVTVTSLDEKTLFSPTFATAAYLPIDPSTADIYLSDIPASRIADLKDSLSDAAGSIIQLHIFLIPSAGNTPIDATACNATIRHLLLTGRSSAGRAEAMGLYGGGGFVYPRGSIGDHRLAASIDQATHRLIRTTAGFEDRLGPGTVSGEFSAVRDDALAKSIAARFQMLMQRLPPPAAWDEDNAKTTQPVKVPAGRRKDGSPGGKGAPVEN